MGVRCLAFFLAMAIAAPALADDTNEKQIRALGPEIAAAYDAKDARKLTAIARDIERGRNGRAKNDAGAALIFRTACKMGSADGCNGYGFMVYLGRGVTENRAQGAQLFQESCKAGSMRGCANYGLALENGRGAPHDPEAAMAHFRRSCDGKEPGGCNNLGRLFEFGLGVKADRAAAAKAYNEALALDPNNGFAQRGLKRLQKTP